MIVNVTKKQLPQIIFLRAIAALMVCFFHLYCGNAALFSNDNFLKKILIYGYLGVPVFFMISGFIICYSLPGDYKFSQFKIFILKRIVRIEPPYIASIFLVFLLNYLAFFFTHIPVQFSWPDFLFHFAYLNNFGLGHYYNVVYWTLGIEFQFYLLIGLLFTFINHSQTSLIISMLIFLLASFIRVSNMQLIFQHISVFGIGIISYFYLFKKRVNAIVYVLFCLAFLLQIYLYVEVATFWATLATIIALHYWKLRHGLIDFFSNISFSLYLTHTIVGGKVINLGLRYANSVIERYLLFALALIASILFAWFFYYLIEKPFIAIGKNIRYKYSNNQTIVENSYYSRS